MDQHPYKHYCRICRKGFACGRALGGHMRAHGINDIDLPDDDDWEDGSSPPKRMYQLRTNPNRLKTCKVCENCGEEFLSWKSFLEHGKCSSEDDIGDVESPLSSDGGDTPAGWLKGKRSRRKPPPPPSSEEEDLANCLVMLSGARVEPIIIVETEESCASASKDEDHRVHVMDRTVALAADKAKAPIIHGGGGGGGVSRGLFECKACKKVFSSHQALGGHRASHKKVKGCFAARLDEMDAPQPEEEVIHQHVAAEMAVSMSMAIVPFDNSPLAIGPLKKKSKVHECSICHRVFASGQALGGHKRCHWITSNSPDPGAMAKLHDHAALTLRPIYEPSDAALDLNYPAPADVSLRLEVPGAMYLQPWIDQRNPNKRNKTESGSHLRNNHSMNPSNIETSVDDEADSKVKMAKLSDLKDINMGGEASQWLQVGIGSSTNEGGGDP